MLDVVNEELNRRRQRADPRSGRLSRRHLRVVRFTVNGIPTAKRREPPSASCTWHVLGRRSQSRSSRFSSPGHRFRSSASSRRRNRSALDRIIEAGGFITVNTGRRPAANLIPVPKRPRPPRGRCVRRPPAVSGCGACVAGVPNSAAAIVHIRQGRAPQSAAPRSSRRCPVENMVETMEMSFGSCTQSRRCHGRPKEIILDSSLTSTATS